MTSFRATNKDHAAYVERVKDVSPVDIAWFGGWLSADGSIGSNPSRPHIRFCLTDIDPLERFAELFGNSIYGPSKQHGLGIKPIYEWKLSGWKAKLVLDRVSPWLSKRYRERADLFDSWKPREHAGRKLTPSDIVTIREALAEGGHGIGKKLAEQFDVTDGMISSIKKGRTWN